MAQSRQDGLRKVIATELEWLANLRWVEPLEYWLTVACAAAIVFTAFAAVALTGQALSLSISAAHFMLLAAIALTAPRPYTWPLLATLALSLLNYSLLLFMNSPLLGTITLAYVWLGVLGGLAALAASGGLMRRWDSVADYTGRDDFQWLLTRGPLGLRWRLRDEIDAVKARQPQPPQD